MSVLLVLLQFTLIKRKINFQITKGNQLPTNCDVSVHQKYTDNATAYFSPTPSLQSTLRRSKRFARTTSAEEQEGRLGLDCPHWIWINLNQILPKIWLGIFINVCNDEPEVMNQLICHISSECSPLICVLYSGDVEQETDCGRRAAEKEDERCVRNSCFDINKSFSVLPSFTLCYCWLPACSACSAIFTFHIISKIFHQNISSIIQISGIV